MTKEQLIAQIRNKQSFLCVGLDPDWEKMPDHIKSASDPIFEFNKAIIEATQDLCVAYKPNLAFYESFGIQGWQALEKTLAIIPDQHFTIADAKRGDIGNTAKKYASAFFEQMNFDALTVAPYMGEDSVRPFLAFDGKWVLLLGLTSNAGSQDFQMMTDQNGQKLHELVITKAQEWSTDENMMFVVGATHPAKLAQVRALAPRHFFLVPGIGAQGGNLQAVAEQAMNDEIGLLVNVGRSILYAGNGADFADKARAAAKNYQQQMAELLP